MIHKSEILFRLCDVESQLDYLQNELIKLEKRIKKYETKK